MKKMNYICVRIDESGAIAGTVSPPKNASVTNKVVRIVF